jgi:hypothetical protein
MSASRPRIDKRLIGTWRSDRARTLRTFTPSPGISPESMRRFKALFGKLVIRWGRGVYRTDCDGLRSVEKYTVIASDASSVVIKVRGPLGPEPELRQIFFDGDCYWIALGGGVCEYFRRVPRGSPNHAMQLTRGKAKRTKTSKVASR